METLIQKVVNAKSGEVKALLWSFGYFFFLLSSYYILRPIRDEMGVAGGVKNLPWMFTATAISLLAAAPLLAALVAKLPRQRFIPVVYLFFVANLLIFWALWKSGWGQVFVARAFFVWVTVFSVFTVSVFWSFMADLFSSEQSKRLFAFIAAGGSLGSLLGPFITRWLAVPLGAANLLLIAAGLLALAVLASNRLEIAAAEVHAATPGFTAASAGREKKAVGGGIFDGFSLLLKSPYMLGIASWVFLLSFAGTVIYLIQAKVVADASSDPSQRLVIFSNINIAVGVFTILIQFVASGRLIARFGTGPAAAFLPLVFLVGFLILAAQPVLLVVTLFNAVQRAANFGVANPARESLFTVLSRDEKFKAKNIVDGAIFRVADAANAWVYKIMALVMMVPMIAVTTAAICAGWLVLSLGLGKSQEKRARQQAEAAH